MTTIEKYRNAFCQALGVTEDMLDGLKYQDIPAWDSVGHMSLVAAIEEQFDIMMDTDDIIDFNSFEKGKQILAENYGIEF